MNEKTITCGAKTINNDMNGPPNVGENNKSAPGPSCMKNGIYSSKTMNKIPPTIHKAYFHQTLKKALIPFSLVPTTLLPAKILELLRMKNTANIGMYTKNIKNLEKLNPLKNGQINLKSNPKMA